MVATAARLRRLLSGGVIDGRLEVWISVVVVFGDVYHQVVAADDAAP